MFGDCLGNFKFVGGVMADSAKGFWALIGATILSAIAWLKMCGGLFKWWDKRRKGK
jgi:hypothetical protein